MDFDECLKDSPKFRHNLKENLNYVDCFETYILKAIKQVNNYIETGRNHVDSQRDLVSALKSLNGSLGSKSNEVIKRVNTLLETLEEVTCLQEIVLDQSARTIGSSLSRLVNDDMFKIREARKSFDKISHEYDQALTKYSLPTKKQSDDTENLLIAISTAFTHTSLDLSIQLTTFQAKKNFELLGSLSSFIKAQNTYFHQGYDLFEDLRPQISDIDDYLHNLEDESELLLRSLPSKHLMVRNNELRPLCFDNLAERVFLEGYLFKRASNGFKVWNRRWFILRDHQLLYQKRGDTQPTVMEEDLRLLSVKPVDKSDSERRFCFEVVSTHKSHILQADSEAACKTWISAIQAGINAAFHDTDNKPTSEIPIASEPVPSNASWSAGFSFKALQQQASSKLNSITNPSDAKSLARGSQTNVASSNNERASDDSDSDANEQELRVDDCGRSYAPISHQEDDDQSAPVKGSKTRINYPVAAQASTESGQPTPADTAKPLEAPQKPQRAYAVILAVPGNEKCADCGATDPKWASINLGITLCIECAGTHRSLGVHLSKVRSLTLDTEVWSPEIVQLMLSLGNTSVNAAYMSCYRGSPQAINADSSREDRESWIKSKYLAKSFMQEPPDRDKDNE